MRKQWLVGLILLLCLGSVGYAAAQDAAKRSPEAEKYVGTWVGTWDGSGSGKFDVTFEKGDDGAMTGKVAVTTDGGDYTARFKSLSFDGNKMTARYDFPLDAQAEVAVTAAFEASTAKGTWSLRPKGQDSEVAGGTWAVSRK